MLRKFAYNKIFRTTGMVLLFFLIIFFPASKEYSLEDENVVNTMSSLKKKEVFLLDKNDYISRVGLSISSNSKEDYAKKLVELLIIDGKYEQKIPNGFKAILPIDTKINDIKIDNDSIYIDLSKEFYDLTSNYEIKAIEILTYNLTTISQISKVYINIDGKILNYLPKSKKNISQPFTRLDGINKKYDTINYKNVKETTIYYASKNNSSYYYIPVTKVNNDEREKIKIIIDELTSSHIYQTNLMSFLNYNTKLLDYEIKDDILTLSFNDFIFDDVDKKSILEEVIYSICLSIRDNYSVKEVIFTVNGDEIAKSVLKNLE